MVTLSIESYKTILSIVWCMASRRVYMYYRDRRLDVTFLARCKSRLYSAKHVVNF